jgi:uncharacterized membrane protein (UPF0127 family)
MKSCDVFVEGNSQDLIARVRVAKSLWSRFWGLMGRRPLRPREGILIDPCSSVHTMFMRFPIDLVFLDGEDRVIKTVAALKPYRIAVGRGSRRVLEIEAGGVDRAGIRVGDRLLIQNVA